MPSSCAPGSQERERLAGAGKGQLAVYQELPEGERAGGEMARGVEYPPAGGGLADKPQLRRAASLLRAHHQRGRVDGFERRLRLGAAHKRVSRAFGLAAQRERLSRRVQLQRPVAAARRVGVRLSGRRLLRGCEGRVRGQPRKKGVLHRSGARREGGEYRHQA